MVTRFSLVAAQLCFSTFQAIGQTPLFQGNRLVNGVGSMTLEAPASGNTSFMFPSTSGANGAFLVSDGAGGSSWASTVGATSLDHLTDAKVGGTGFTNSIIIGHRSTGSLSAGDAAENNVAFGGGALSKITSGDDNVAVGVNSQLEITSGSANTTVGFDAGRTTGGSTQHNTLIGYFTKRNFTVGNKTGDYNTAVGSRAFEEANGSYNVVLGYFAGNLNRASNNIAVGYSAMYPGTSTGGNNVALGTSALGRNGSGTENIAIGQAALWGGIANAAASYNIGIGTETGYALTTGAQNTVIGYQAGRSLTEGTGNVLVGYQAGYSLTTQSNQLYIDNSSTATPLIQGDFSSDALTINGSLAVTAGVTFAHDAAATVVADAAVVDASAVTALEITSDGNDATDVLTINNGTNGSVLYLFYIVPATHTDDVRVDGTTYALGTGKSTGLTFIRINNAWRLAGSVEYP
jgi:hypothetical protein